MGLQGRFWLPKKAVIWKNNVDEKSVGRQLIKHSSCLLLQLIRRTSPMKSDNKDFLNMGPMKKSCKNNGEKEHGKTL